MESPDEIAWNYLISTLFELINAKLEYAQAESDFKAGNGSFDVYKIKRFKANMIEMSLKAKFDAYVLDILNRGEKPLDL